MPKPSLAIETLSICAGCEIAVLDLHGALPGVLDAIDLKYAQVLMDPKQPPEGITVGFVSGAVRNEEQVEQLHRMRDRCAVLVAFGSCAAFGGVPGLGNLHSNEELLKEAYIDAKSNVNPTKVLPSQVVPAMLPEVHAISDFVKVDAVLPGCPPPPKLIGELVTALLAGKPFHLAAKTVCDQCPMKREEKNVSHFYRWGTRKADPKRCFLDQGFQCLGPVTQGGCEGRCPTALSPCRGCFGPTEHVTDQAAKMIGALASVITKEVKNAPSPEQVVKEIPDIIGTFLRFSLPISTFKKAYRQEVTKK